MVLLVLLLSGVGRKWGISEGVNYNSLCEGLLSNVSPVLSWILFYCAENPWYETQPLNRAVCHASPLILRVGLCDRHLELTHLAWLKCLLVSDLPTSLPQPRATTILPFESMNLPSVLDLCVSRIVQYLALQVWLISGSSVFGAHLCCHMLKNVLVSWLSALPLCEGTTVSLPVHPSMDIQVISTSRLLWTGLQWTREHASTLRSWFQFIWKLRCLWASELMELC